MALDGQQRQPRRQRRLSDSHSEKEWIRGVNIGGWLLAERFITPYLFAVNTCHLEGSLCWYPGQIGGNATNLCPSTCQPVRPVRVTDGNADFHPLHDRAYYDYPVDEFTLGQAFHNRSIARQYMERHWDTFLTYQDLVDLKEAGVTHMRVPMSFWIRGDLEDEEPFISGAWPYFVRMAQWTREIGGMQIWADLHGAPGSENGFDNSGHNLFHNTCEGWTKKNVERTVDILADIAQGIADEELTDVVTGFGLLNEPFLDCDPEVVRDYYNRGLKVVRTAMGPDTSVFVGDMFNAWNFNDGFWTEPTEHYETYLDTHPYHVFFEKGRAFTPRQHIAYVCRHGQRETVGCCYEDAPDNNVPSKGISRIIGEWSAAYDALPTALAPYIMKTIAAEGEAPLLDRQLSSERIEFMTRFVEAQMVSYESRDVGVSSGWLFWNFKMEGGAFAEWDFLRGVREGWMPRLPEPTVASEDVYGSCYDIYNRTSDDYYAIVEEYPDPRTLDWRLWQGWDANDDFVMSDPAIPSVDYGPHPWYAHWELAIFIVLGGMLYQVIRRHVAKKARGRVGYQQLK